MIETITTAAHTAFVDATTGSGCLVRPLSSDDISAGGSASLHAADWNAMIRHLGRMGWELLENEETGMPCVDGVAPDGREVVAFYGREAVEVDLDVLFQVQEELQRLIGHRFSNCSELDLRASRHSSGLGVVLGSSGALRTALVHGGTCVLDFEVRCQRLHSLQRQAPVGTGTPLGMRLRRIACIATRAEARLE